MFSSFKAFFGHIAGNVTIMTALVMVPVLGGVGVAIDYARRDNVREKLAAALDGAVLAGAVASSNNAKTAEQYFDSNFVSGDVKRIARSFTVSGSTKVEGVASATLDPGLSTVLGISGMSVEVASAAETVTTVGKSSNPKICILALSPTATQSLLANSGADVNAASCEIHVKSTANPAAIFNSGSTIKASKTCIQGSKIIDNGGTHPNLATGCTTVADPYAGKIAEPSSAKCNYSNLNYSGKTTLNPGVYCGWHNFNSGSNVTLKAGTYIIKSGGWNVNGGKWDGQLVTFYFADTSKIQFNSAVQASLTPPNSGTYKDILFAEKSGLSATQFIFDDNKNFDMTGIVYLPSREVVFNSGTTTRSHKMTVVMRTVIFNSVKWNLTHYDDGNNSGGGSTEVSVRLTK